MAHQVRIGTVVALLRENKVPDPFGDESDDPDQDAFDCDEAECILVNLIYKGWIKGYVSHEHQMLVLSKALPFPQISEVVKKAPQRQ